MFFEQGADIGPVQEKGITDGLQSQVLVEVRVDIGKDFLKAPGGQRQRIVIARALAVKPSILVADEPTSMLDVSIGIDIMNLMLDLQKKEGLTYLYITHNLASARYMANPHGGHVRRQLRGAGQHGRYHPKPPAPVHGAAAFQHPGAFPGGKAGDTRQRGFAGLDGET